MCTRIVIDWRRKTVFVTYPLTLDPPTVGGITLSSIESLRVYGAKDHDQ